jgi:undecaprenyl-diphosphatase
VPRFLRYLEVRTLALFAAVGAAVYLFLDLSDEVSENDTSTIDRAIMLAFRTPGDPSDPIGSRTFEEAMRDVTALGGFTVLTVITLIATAALVYFGRRRQALVFFATIALAQVASEVLKTIFQRPRPDLVPHGSYVYSMSFPSGHSLLAAATFLTLAGILAGMQPHRGFKAFVFAIAGLMIIAIGVSRVYLGVHWPTDVLGGWTLGAAFALAARLVLGFWKEPESTRRTGAEPPAASG